VSREGTSVAEGEPAAGVVAFVGLFLLMDGRDVGEEVTVPLEGSRANVALERFRGGVG